MVLSFVTSLIFPSQKCTSLSLTLSSPCSSGIVACLFYLIVERGGGNHDDSQNSVGVFQLISFTSPHIQNFRSVQFPFNFYGYQQTFLFVAPLLFLEVPYMHYFFSFCKIFFWGFFFFILYSALLHLTPLRFPCADGCWDQTKGVGRGPTLAWPEMAFTKL
jgi:hypothetical protein